MAEKYGRDGIGGRGYLQCTFACCKKQSNLKSKTKICFNRKNAGLTYDFTSFLEALPLKTPQEVLEYSEAFWQHHSRIENGSKYIERIEKGEQEIERRRIVDLSIKLKFDALIKACKNSGSQIDQFALENIALDDAPKSEERDLSVFSKTEDRICALGLFRYGYGSWELIRNDIRNCQELAFNWVARSRTTIDI